MNRSSLHGLLRPVEGDLPPEPRVGIEEKISRAIERMAAARCDRIAVVKNGAVVGMVVLDEALRAIGLMCGGEEVPPRDG